MAMERIYVTVRSRPLSSDESKTSPWRISGDSIFLTTPPSSTTKFDFDHVFAEDSKTADIFDARIKEIVSSAVRGFNGTVFAYGQTSSGKTHTMRGTVSEPGIMPLAVHDLFKSIEEDLDREFLVRMSYMEIYNEDINDLLAPEHRKLQVHESIERGIYIAGLKEEIVTSPQQVLDLMERGESYRHTGQTNMNIYSSRSHTIFRMIIESREKIEDGDVGSPCDAVRVSILNLVDLAGSERANKTGAEGLRLKEGSHINKSLMTLGTVIKKLSEGVESQGGHVPYRDSKLTRILQPALGGNANTALICNITLAQIHTDETKSSLQFASRALRVTNCACVNEILSDAALLKRQRKEIEELRAKLVSSHSDHLEEELLNLRNTLLQSELEKERIALELEEAKKAKAHRDKTLQEQAKKIANLSSLVLYTEKDEKNAQPIKNKRRDTWHPSMLQKSSLKEFTSNDEYMAEGFKRNEENSYLPPFEDLIQDNEVGMSSRNDLHVDTVDNGDKWDGLTCPDAHALLNVTSRRKIKRAKSLQKNERYTDSETPACKSVESDCSTRISSSLQLRESSSHERRDIQIQESEAVLKIKQLHDQVSREVHEIVFEIGSSKSMVQSILFFVKDLFQDFSAQSETLQGLKSFSTQHIAQAESNLWGNRKIKDHLKKRINELELEKNEFRDQLVDREKEINDLKCDVAEQEKTMADERARHELEKDEFLYQVLSLQNEVSCLSSSTLAREKDSLRKELDKTKLKLRDTDSKLKNIMQEKVKLESEKVQAEREIKQLHSQKAILERDSWKHDSVADKRVSKSQDPSKTKGPHSTQEQNLQDEYAKLQALAFEMEDEIAYLREILEESLTEKKETLVRNETLEAEIRVLEDENNKLKQMISESESLSKHLEDSINSLSKQKDEMAMQITDALLEVEAERSLWSAKEKTFFESEEELKIAKEQVLTLSKDLLEVRNELTSSREQCTLLKEEITVSQEKLREEKLQENIEITKMRFRLGSTQAKLDAFRGNYKDLLTENKLMDKKYKEASTNLKNQLRQLGEELLKCKKQLANINE